MADDSHEGQSAEHDGNTTPLPSNGIEPPKRIPGALDARIQEEKPEVMQRFWEAVKRLPAYIRLATYLAKDTEVPKQAKAILAVGGGYAVSPIDFVPGIIPVAGQLDDLYVLLTAIQQSLKRTPADVADRHLATAKITREDIDGDLQAVRTLVRTAVVKTVVIGGKTLGRVSRATFGFANEQLKRRNSRRAEGPQ